jgi:tetratricopeptide (TPR) repeat protein
VDPVAWWRAAQGRARTASDRIRAARALASLGVPDAGSELRETAAERVLAARLAPYRHEKAEILQRAVDAAPSALAALVAQAELLLDRQRPLVARGVLSEARAVAPGDVRVALLTARLASENQLAGVAAGTLDAALALHPEVPALELARAMLAHHTGDLARAAALFESLLDTAVPGQTPLFWLHEIASTRRDAAHALALSQRLAAAHPDVMGHALRVARDALDAGLPDVARAAIDGMPALAAAHPDLLADVARLRYRMGEDAGAIAALQRSLEIDPQAPGLRAFLEHLVPDEAPFEAPFRRDPDALARELPPLPAPPATEYLLHQRVVRLHPGGLSTAWVQRVLRIGDPGPARSRTLVIPYDGYTEVAEVVRAEVRKASGEVVPAHQRDETSLSEAWYGLYYDRRQIEIGFGGLDAGDVIVVEHRVHETGGDLPVVRFSDLFLIRDWIPKREVAYALLVPQGAEIDARLVDPLGRTAVSAVRREEGPFEVAEWHIRDVEALYDEPDMPGFSEVSPYIHASSFRSYEEVASYYGALVREQSEADAAIRDYVGELTAGVSERAERLRILHDALVRDIRYVGLEFGVHGYKPYACSLVFARRFGDCKDQSTLLRAMLAEAGIQADLVLLRTRPFGRVPPQPASLAVFDHAVLYVPEYDLWIDPTATFYGIGQLPPATQGCTALVIGDGGGRLVTTPVTSPSETRSVQTARLTLDATGGARMDGELVATGLFGPPLRETFAEQLTRDERLQDSLAQDFPGLSLDAARWEGMDALGAPLRVRWEGRTAVGVAHEGDRLVASGLWEPDYAQRFAPATRRTADLLLDFPRSEVRILEVTPPAGWVPAMADLDEGADSPFGSFHASLELRDGRVVRSLELVLDVQRVPAEQYPVFRSFLRRADELARGAIVFARAPEPAL